MVFQKRDSSTEKELSTLTTATPTPTPTPVTTSKPTLTATDTKTPPVTATFARQTSKSDGVVGQVSTTSDKKLINDVVVAAVEKANVVTPPIVEKSYLNSPEKIPAAAANSNIESPRSTTSSPTKTPPSVIEGTSKPSSSSHFVGGWKVPSSPTKEVSSPLREDRKSLGDDKEDMTLLERVSIIDSVISKKSPNVFKSCPKNDFTRKIKYFDTFTKIA